MGQVLKTAPAPGSKQWTRTLTASKIGTILGLNPWKTANELWMEMSGLAEPEHLDDGDDRLAWGHCAEDSLVNFWLHKNPGWNAGPGEVAYTDDSLPFANFATLDRRVLNRKNRRADWFQILECKTSNSTDLWGDGTRLPGMVAAQGMGQMGISGIHKWSAVVQVGSTVPNILPMEWDESLWMDGMVPTITTFMKSLGDDTPPMPSQDVIDALTARTILMSFDDDAELPADDYGYLAWLELKHQIADLEAKKRKIEAGFSQWADGRGIKIDGKKFAYVSKGRFSASKVGDDVKHLLMHPDVMTPRLDLKKLQEHFPDVYRAGVGDDSYRFKAVD